MEDTLHQFETTIARSLLAAAGSSGNGDMNATSYLYGGPQIMHAAIGVNWFAFSVCVASLLFYAFHYSKQYTGWEEVYVCVVELAKVTLEIFAEQYAPATITTVDGKHVAWLRYAEWLLTCPVILIHMSNITGLNSEYNKRTMTLLVTDIGCIVMGVAAAFASGYVKVIFYLLGCAYACNQFLNSAKVYMEAYKEVPPGKCQDMIKLLAYLFFASWLAFPLLFLVGPEGFGQISVWGAVMGHTIADLFAKNLWGLMAHQLRIMIAMEIIAGWDPDAHQQARDKAQIEQQPGSTYTDNSARNSGEEPGVVAVLRRMGSYGAAGKSYTDDSAHKPSDGPVRAVLAVTTNDMIEYFQSVVSALTVPLEVTSAIGESALIQLAHDSTPSNTDVILIPAEFCSIGGRDGVVAKLKALGHRVIAYGWTASTAEGIEACDVDGYLEGPSWGKGINAQQFALTLVQMQEKRIRASQAAQGGGMTRTFSNTNFTASNPLYSTGVVAGSPAPPAGGAAASRTSPLGRQSPVGAIARSLSKSRSINEGRNSPVTPAALNLDFGGQVRGNSSAGGNTNSNVIGVYNPPRSPRGTSAVSPGRISGSNPDLVALATAAGVRANANLSETEMLQQLMGEISRLKKELGE